jgi:flagellar biosynthesis protein FliR
MIPLSDGNLLDGDLLPWALGLRSLGFLLSLPFGELLGILPRFFLAVGLGFILQPLCPTLGDITGETFILEFVIGFILGAPLRLLSDLSEMLGELIDSARGQTISAVLDPLSGQGVSDLATVVRSAAVVIAVCGGALEISVLGLADSVRHASPGTVQISPFTFQEVLSVGGNVVLKGLQMSGVWFGAFLMIEVMCAITSRVMTGLSFSQTSHLLKSCVTFTLLAMLLARVEGGSLAGLVKACLARTLVGERSLLGESPDMKASLEGSRESL